MIEVAEAEGKLKPGATIIEGTSGNTGMGLAIAAIMKGYKCIFTTTDKQSKEKVDALKAFGAEVIVCPTDVEPEDPRSYYSVSSRLEREVPNSWKPNQYDNPANALAHYESTGPEIWEQTEGKITHLIVGVGTGGTISGTGKYLKEKNLNLPIEIEVRNLTELEEALEVGGVVRIMLDNFDYEKTREALKIIAGRFPVESSGNINPQTVRAYADCGVDYVSMGYLTHSAKSLDLSLKAMN
jgi:threonine dehydratase